MLHLLLLSLRCLRCSNGCVAHTKRHEPTFLCRVAIVPGDPPAQKQGAGDTADLVDEMQDGAETPKPKTVGSVSASAHADGSNPRAKQKDAKCSSNYSVFFGLRTYSTICGFLRAFIKVVCCVLIVPNNLRHYEVAMSQGTKSDLVVKFQGVAGRKGGTRV